MNITLTTSAIEVLQHLQQLGDGADFAARRKHGGHWEFLARNYTAQGVDLTWKSDPREQVTPLEQMVQKIAPQLDFCEVTNTSTVGQPALRLYGPKVGNEPQPCVVLPLDKTLSYFEEAWVAGVLHELLPDDVANELGLFDFADHLIHLSLVRDREL